MIYIKDDLLLLAFLLSAFIFLRKYLQRRHNFPGLPYPPGPPPRFLVGNLFDVPKERPHLTFAKWCYELFTYLRYIFFFLVFVV